MAIRTLSPMGQDDSSRKRTVLIAGVTAVVVLFALCGAVWGLSGKPSNPQALPSESAASPSAMGFETADHVTAAQRENSVAIKPVTQSEKSSKADFPNRWGTKLREVNQQAVAKLGSQLRVNLAAGSVIFAVVATLALSIFAIYWFKFRAIESTLPIVAPPPVPKTNLLFDIPQSSTITKVVWALAGVFFIALVIVQTMDASDKFHNEFTRDVLWFLIISALTFLTVSSLLVGLWQLGALVNLSIVTFVQTPATSWLIASSVACVVSIAIVLVLKIAEQENYVIAAFIGLIKVVVFSMLFGALGSIGGIYATACALVAILFLSFLTLKVSPPETEANTKVHLKFLILAIIFAVGSVVSVYFGIGLGSLSCALMIVSSIFVAFYGMPRLTHRKTGVADQDELGPAPIKRELWAKLRKSIN